MLIIGDMVNEKQRDMAWSWQQIFSNLGGIIATLLPYHISNNHFIGLHTRI
jgi:maltose/moltooligosaccharide transporter